MSKRLEVVSAIKALIETAVPTAKVIGLEGDEAFPTRIPAEGLIAVRNTHPGEPDIDLSPPSYRYEHAIKIELAFIKSADATAQQRLDEALVVLGQQIEADRHLGARCEWLDAFPAEIGPIATDMGAQETASTAIDVVATYCTPNSLT